MARGLTLLYLGLAFLSNYSSRSLRSFPCIAGVPYCSCFVPVFVPSISDLRSVFWHLYRIVQIYGQGKHSSPTQGFSIGRMIMERMAILVESAGKCRGVLKQEPGEHLLCSQAVAASWTRDVEQEHKGSVRSEKHRRELKFPLISSGLPFAT
jgi:hypothetical protein